MFNWLKNLFKPKTTPHDETDDLINCFIATQAIQTNGTVFATVDKESITISYQNGTSKIFPIQQIISPKD